MRESGLLPSFPATASPSPGGNDRLGGRLQGGGQASHEICQGDGKRGGKILRVDGQQEQQRREHERRGDAFRSVHRSPHAEIRQEGKRRGARGDAHRTGTAVRTDREWQSPLQSLVKHLRF